MGQKGVVLNVGNHQIEGTLLAGRKWNAKGFKPSQYTGRLDYSNHQLGADGFVQADEVGQGTNLNAGFKYTLLQNSLFGVDLTGYFRKLIGINKHGKPEFETTLHLKIPLLKE